MLLGRRSWAGAIQLGLALLLVGASGACSQASDDAVLGRTWPAAQRVSIDRVDHSAYTALLGRYVDQSGMVDYATWKATAADIRALDAYLETLSRANPDASASREGQLAFWINAYNAVTLRGILREYPTSSIRNHTAKVVGYNIWDDLLLHVGDGRYSLNQIEHDVLRKMGDWRIHFAINCASIGCPRLLAEAYVPQKLEQQLVANTQQFFSDPRKFRHDPAGRLYITQIIKWFAEDFGATPAERLRTIAPYLPTEAARQLAASGSAQFSYLDYDWGLNDRSAQRAARR